MTARVSGVARPVGRFSELPLDEDHAPRTIREFDQVNTFVGIGRSSARRCSDLCA